MSGIATCGVEGTTQVPVGIVSESFNEIFIKSDT